MSENTQGGEEKHLQTVGKLRSSLLNSEKPSVVKWFYVSLKRRSPLPHMGYLGMCGPKGYGFLAVSVGNSTGYRF